MTRNLAVSAVLFIVGLAGARTAGAQPAPENAGRRLQWRSDWRTFDGTDAALTAGLGASALLIALLVEERDEGWRGENALDAAGRGVLRFSTPGGRKLARRASDVLEWSLISYPLVLEDGVLAWGVDRNGNVARQMLLLDLQAYALSAFVSVTSKAFIGRERPLVAECREDPTYDPSCNDSTRYDSFVSGHTLMAFTGASLMCLHQEKLRIYGDGPGANVPCYVGLAAAATTGLLRVASDKHYTTDVLAGAAVGAFSGYVLPRLWRFADGDDHPAERRPRTGSSIGPTAGAGTIGLSWQGTFE